MVNESIKIYVQQAAKGRRVENTSRSLFMRMRSWDLLWDKITSVRILIESVISQLVIRYIRNLKINLVGKSHVFFVGKCMVIFIITRLGLKIESP